MYILDLQLQWSWVWVLQMGSSCTVMILQREMWTRNYQHCSTTTGIFITASIIPLQMILVSQLCIYLPSPLMIDPPLHKRSQYTPDMLLAAIYFPSENYLSNLTTPSDSPDILPTYDTNTLHVMKKYEPYRGRDKIWYCCRKHGQKYATKRQGSVAPHAMMKTRDFIIFMWFPG